MMSCNRKMKALRGVVGGSLLLLIAGATIFSQAQQPGDSVNCGLRPSLKIDEYGAIGRGEEEARLEKLLLALAAEKDSHAFIVTYGGRLPAKNDTQSRADSAKRYLVEKHGFFGGAEVTNSHINTLTCGYRDVAATELWITPAGAAPPRCTPTISAPIQRGPRARRTRT